MIFTIDSDDEIAPEVEEEEEEVVEPVSIKKAKKADKKKAQKLPEFRIEFDTGDILPIKPKNSTTKPIAEVDDSDDDSDEEIGDNVKKINAVEQRIARSQKGNSKSKKQDEEEEQDEVRNQFDEEEEDNVGMNDADEQEFFEEVIDTTRNKSSSSMREQSQIIFSQLNISRPFLRAIEAMGYTHPTPIQTQVIPFALSGRDICASAVTGSGKTVAFLLPSLERLLYRPKDIAAIRVLVITPTRELANQIHEVFRKLSQFTDITGTLICGGAKDVRSQEATLRQHPDLVICTPGRMLDHLRNSATINLELLNILILDEVDRLLELGFQEEVEELIKYCPVNRQTMLFSATMTPRIEDLIKLSLKRPVRIKTESSHLTVAPRLVQEFVKVKDKDDVEAILLSLIQRGFHQKTIVFFELKREAHRFCALLNLSEVRAVELHGDLPQIQRFMSLDAFRTGEVDVLVATDVAARGIDIPGVQTVINAEMPRNVSIYVHRVGRTARAGCGGRSITLVSDDRRKIMKDVLKAEARRIADLKAAEAKSKKSRKDQAEGEEDQPEAPATSNQILSRAIPSAVIAHYLERIASLEGRLNDFMRDERDRIRLEILTRKTETAENLLLHEAEIKSRPARTWFQTKTQKQELREQARGLVREEVESLTRGKRKAEEEEEQGQGSGDEGEEEEQEDKELAADRRLRLLALRDDYRLDETEKGSKKLLEHRMSRKKRRRLEALKASAEADEEEKEKGGKSTASTSLKQVKAQQREKQMERIGKIGKTAGELTMKKITVVSGDEDPDSKPHKKTKVLRQTFAFGGFDQDIQEHSSSSLNRLDKKRAVPRDEWKDFDPNKRLKKGGKTGTASFKSKKRYKRRK